MSLLLRMAATMVAVWVAAWLVPGIVVGGSAAADNSAVGQFGTLALISIVIGLVNTFVKPIAKGLSSCLILLTLGVFLLVVNAAMLMLTAWLCGRFGVDFQVSGWPAAFLGSIIVSVVSGAINGLTGADREQNRRGRD